MARMFLAIPMRIDEERDERGGGKALLCAVKRELAQAGFTIVEDVESWDDYGWSLAVEHDGTSIRCMVQPSDDWLIQCWPQTGLIDRLKGRDCARAHREVMDAILSALTRERSLRDAKWMSEAEIRGG